MLHACFSVAQLIANMTSTELTCSRCGNVDICTNLIEHILINCAMVLTCRELFEQIVIRHFDSNVCNLLCSLNHQEYIGAHFGLNINLVNVLHEDYYINKVIIFFLSAWSCYRHAIKISIPAYKDD